MMEIRWTVLLMEIGWKALLLGFYWERQLKEQYLESKMGFEKAAELEQKTDLKLAQPR